MPRTLGVKRLLLYDEWTPSIYLDDPKHSFPAQCVAIWWAKPWIGGPLFWGLFGQAKLHDMNPPKLALFLVGSLNSNLLVVEHLAFSCFLCLRVLPGESLCTNTQLRPLKRTSVEPLLCFVSFECRVLKSKGSRSVTGQKPAGPAPAAPGPQPGTLVWLIRV